MKQNIPGFYGVGSAIEELEQEDKLEELKMLYRESLFFRTLLSNSMQSLKKCFYPASAYLENNPEYGEFWKLLYAEFVRSVEKLKEVSGMTELLEDNPVSKASIEIRERIVLPLITIQQYAIQRGLENGASTEVLDKLILRTMFGIINAMRNAA
jgi:phosphoenolpyruvate carboxylase